MRSVRFDVGATEPFRLGEFEIRPSEGEISRSGECVRVDLKAMAVLVHLADRAGRLIPKEELLRAVWPDTAVEEVALPRAISELRRALGDDSRAPRYIETLHKRGYRLIASMAPLEPRAVAGEPQGSAGEYLGVGSIRVTKRRAFIALSAVALISAGGLTLLLTASRAKRPPPPAVAGPAIAVLPFTNLSGDPDQEYFASGITDDLITDLSKISGLLVIARNSTFAYKDKHVDVRTVARELGVSHVLEGSTRRVEGQLRVNAQLIDATTGAHLWAERYDGTVADIFALQDRINRKIVAALAVELTAEEQERVSHNDTDNVDAYDAFLLGWEHYLRETPDDLVEAVSHLNVAVELDPDFARAHAALAEAYERSIGRGWWKLLGMELGAIEEQAQRHLLMASRQPTPIAHQVRSRMLLRARRHEEAIAELERALALDPNSFLGHVGMAWALSLAGQPERATSYAARAARLDPGTRARALWELGFAQFGMEQYAAAVASLERALKLNPDLSQWPLMAAYTHLGKPQQAVATRKAYFERRGWQGKHNVSTMLHYYPYKRQADEERFARGLLGAGVPGYYKMAETSKLNGKQIRALLFGRRRTGIEIASGRQFWVTYSADGRATRRGGCCDAAAGQASIEGDRLCEAWQRPLWGDKRCMFVYHNPDGTPEGLDQYVSEYDDSANSVLAWSLVD